MYPMKTKGTFSCVADGRTPGTFPDEALIIFRGRGTVVPVESGVEIIVLTIIEIPRSIRAGGETVTATNTFVIIDDHNPILRALPGGIDRTDLHTRGPSAVHAYVR